MVWKKVYLSTLTIVLLTLGIAPSLAAAPAYQALPLVNPSFEEPYTNGAANAWYRWHQDSGDKCVNKPADWNFSCQPGWGQEYDYNNYGLKRSGVSQHVGAQYTPWHAGVMQTVNVPAGTRVRFSVWGYSRASNDQPPAASVMDRVPRMQVGIDPNGGGVWTSASIVWSSEVNALDAWVQLSVEATVGSGGKVTVFTSSRFALIMPLAHQDTWWDEAMLASVTPPAPATAAGPTVAPQPTQPSLPPAVTAAPQADGSIIHTVRAGDTLGYIAALYDVSVSQIQQLNNLGSSSLIRTGQQLIIRGATAPPTNTPPPVPPTAEASPTPTTGSICALVFNDRNADTSRQVESEELVPNATLLLNDATSLMGQHNTDGLTEPYCFTGLVGGSYLLVMQPPPGYVASGADQIALILGAGGQLDAVFGVQRSEGTPTPTSSPNGGDGGGGGSGGGGSATTVLRWGAIISGIIILLLAAVVLVVFALSRLR